MIVTSTVPMYWPQTGSGATDFGATFQIIALYPVLGVNREETIALKRMNAKESQREFLRRKWR